MLRRCTFHTGDLACFGPVFQWQQVDILRKHNFCTFLQSSYMKKHPLLLHFSSSTFPTFLSKKNRFRTLSSIYDDSKPLSFRQILQLERPQHLTAALGALGRRQRWAEALRLLAPGVFQRLPLSLESFNSAAFGAVEGEAWGWALEVLGQVTWDLKGFGAQWG